MQSRLQSAFEDLAMLSDRVDHSRERSRSRDRSDRESWGKQGQVMSVRQYYVYILFTI